MVGLVRSEGRMGQPEETAAAALYFASDESRFTTGPELVIDGGYTVQWLCRRRTHFQLR